MIVINQVIHLCLQFLYTFILYQQDGCYAQKCLHLEGTHSSLSLLKLQPACSLRGVQSQRPTNC